MADSVRIICPNLKCRAILSVPNSARGKVVRCRECGTRVRIPDAARAPGEGTPSTSQADAGSAQAG